LANLTSMDFVWLAAALAGAGVFAGLLAGIFGIGGGAVLVPVFYPILGLMGIDDAVRMHVSVGTSLAIIVPTSIRSFLSHKRKGAVDMALLRNFVFSVPAGVLLAALVFASISGEGLRAIFAMIALVLGLRLLLDRPEWRLGDSLPVGAGRFAVGTAIGLVSTLMGIGGGVMNNTFMTLYNRPIHQAVATSAGVGVLISLPGLAGSIWAGWGEAGLPFLSTGFVNWIAVALIVPITLTVAPVGVRIAHKLEKRQLETWFGVFMLVVAARFFYSLV
jgi:uncharacterized protein